MRDAIILFFMESDCFDIVKQAQQMSLNRVGI